MPEQLFAAVGQMLAGMGLLWFALLLLFALAINHEGNQ